MKQAFKKFVTAAAFIAFVASPVMAVASPIVSSTAAAACNESGILGIPPWYRGLTQQNNDGSCSIQSPNGGDKDALSKFIWKIVLNIINMALVIAVYIAIFFIIYGGFLFMTGGDKPGQLEKARKSIFDAIIGLVISMGAIAIVNFVFGLVK